jgi:D-arabinose 5-phosphate isomerase GutQ
MAVLAHVPSSIPVLAITSQTRSADCLLLRDRADAILLPAPIHELEEVSFGVCAPTTSTTVAIAVGDMLMLTLAQALHADDTKHVFKRNHPGGAIGATAKRKASELDTDEVTKCTKKHAGLMSPA